MTRHWMTRHWMTRHWMTWHWMTGRTATPGGPARPGFMLRALP